MGGGRTTSGQVSMEYILIMSFAFLMLAAITYVAYSQSASFSNDVSTAQLQKIGQEISDAADTVYYAGPPSRKTIKVYFPQQIRNTTLANNSIVFVAQGDAGTYEYSVNTIANLTGAIRSYSGLHVITLTAYNDKVNFTDS